MGVFLYMCWGAGSNRRPFALQANALPTELPQQKNPLMLAYFANQYSRSRIYLLPSRRSRSVLKIQHHLLKPFEARDLPHPCAEGVVVRTKCFKVRFKDREVESEWESR